MSEYRNYNNIYEGSNAQNTQYAGGWNTASGPSQDRQPKKHSSKAGRIAKKIGAITLSAVLFGGVASGTFQAVNYLTAPAETESAQSASSSGNAQVLTTSSAVAGTTAGSMDVADIAEAVMPSIVSITNRSVQEVQNYFSMFGYGAQTMPQEMESCGSGIIIGQNDSELLVVTNYHVIENADSLSVCFIDNKAYEASVKGTDAANDLAVISIPLSSISADTMSQISIATLGDSNSLRVGEQVVAIGNALGYGQSVTTGIVSATNRTLTNTSLQNGSSTTSTYIQTDAAINPGNSGGALVNMKGEVVGINSAKLASTEVEGMGYAIPVSRVSSIISTLMTETTRTRVAESEQGSLGISVVGVNENVTAAYGIPTGVYVAEVTPGSSAEAAGLRRGDVITAFDGKSVTDVSQLQDVMQYYKAGETVELTLQSIDANGSYAEKTVSVTLSSSSSGSENSIA